MDKGKIRMILKFDVGADGFLKMIFVLFLSAVLLFCVGTFFLITVTKDLRGLS